MRLIDAKCPNCGAVMQIDADRQKVFCTYCGNQLIVDDEITRLKLDNAEQAGYEFERGRQRALRESGAQNMYQSANALNSPRNKIAALLLCFFLGYFGVHRFYVGKTMSGLVYLLTLGLFGIGWLYDLIVIATGSFRDAEGRYLR